MSLRVATHNLSLSSLPSGSSVLREGVVPRTGGERDSAGFKEEKVFDREETRGKEI